MNAFCAIVSSDDYIDEEVAYLLGMLFGRGQLIDDGAVRRLIITLDIRKTKPVLPPGVELDMDLDVENERALNEARRHVNDLLDANVDVSPVRKGKAELSATFVKRTIAWRDLEMLCCNGTDRSTFRLPDFFFDFPAVIREQFVRGYADIAVTPSFSDHVGERARIAFPVVFDNRHLLKQLCRLFESLDVKPQCLEGAPEKRGGRRREHRIRPYAEDYERIGFCFKHKQRLLELLVKHNRNAAKRPGQRRGATA